MHCRYVVQSSGLDTYSVQSVAGRGRCAMFNVHRQSVAYFLICNATISSLVRHIEWRGTSIEGRKIQSCGLHAAWDVYVQVVTGHLLFKIVHSVTGFRVSKAIYV